jgi:hypothetical protein
VLTLIAAGPVFWRKLVGVVPLLLPFPLVFNTRILRDLRKLHDCCPLGPRRAHESKHAPGYWAC